MATIPEALAVAVAHHKGGRLAEAEEIYRQILARAPDHADALQLLGVAAHQAGRYDLAIQYIRRAIAVNADEPVFHNNLSTALQCEGKLEEAAECCRRALELKPDYADACSNLGSALRGQGKLDEAEACCRRALELQPDHAGAHSNLGSALRAGGRLEAAEASFRRALELDPALAEAHNNLGNVLYLQGRHGEAGASYRRALELSPDLAVARHNAAMLMLLMGDFENGWREYEWRWRIQGSAPRRFAQPAWDGGPLSGRTCLLFAEQGLGDVIQFVRYAPLVKQRGATTIVECPRPLLPLLATCPGIDRLVARGDPLPAFDVHIPLLGVPRLLTTSLAAVPAGVPYLSAEPALAERWRRGMAGVGGLRVGINWRGRPGPGLWTRRDVPPDRFAALAAVPGVRLIGLQKGPLTPEEEAATRRLGLWNADGELDRDAAFIDAAALMANLDIVVTSDTAVAHLAGALGVPVWVALPFAPHWCWLLNRDDSPWYPTMRLFRQRSPGDWAEVFGRIAAALQERVAAAARGRCRWGPPGRQSPPRLDASLT